jgi:hypothetical protein
MDGALGFTPAIGTGDDLSLARVPIGKMISIGLVAVFTPPHHISSQPR